MENQFLLDLSLRYALDGAQMSKLSDAVTQCDTTVDSELGQKIATFICESNLVDKPMEEILEAVRLEELIA